MRKNQNYIFTAFLTVVFVAAGLLLLSMVPSFKVGDRVFKRVNILSDIVETPVDEVEVVNSEDVLLMAEADSVLLSIGEDVADSDVAAQTSRVAQAASPSSAAVVSEPWEVDQSVGTAANSKSDLDRPLVSADEIGASGSGQSGSQSGVVLIDDFGEGESAMAYFRAAMTSRKANRPLRIAVLGDSFIENDIITADLREQFQAHLGGNGVGFVAFATPIAKYRATIEHTFSGWENYSIMNIKKTPEKYKDKFFVSGLLCIPEEGARVTMKSTTFRKYTQQSTVARLLFINEGATKIKVVVNDSQQRVFEPKASTQVQEIVINGNIEKLDMTFNDVDGFVGYGVVFEDRSGVSVDNYSVRGTSGLPLFRTSAKVNRKINDMLGYDLVILEYGLNVMQAEVLKYDSFSNSLSRIIKYVRSCFPDASIMVMGVGDRCHNTGEGYQTMKAVYGVLEAQQKAAKAEGVAFWNTFEAMGGHNSMKGFVERKWAGKDHLHIGYGGGRYIARAMYESLMNFERSSGELIVADTVAAVDTLMLQLDTLQGSAVDSMASQGLSGDSLAVDSVKLDTAKVKMALDTLGTDAVSGDTVTKMSADTIARDTASRVAADSSVAGVVLDSLTSK